MLGSMVARANDKLAAGSEPHSYQRELAGPVASSPTCRFGRSRSFARRTRLTLADWPTLAGTAAFFGIAFLLINGSFQTAAVLAIAAVAAGWIGHSVLAQRYHRTVTFTADGVEAVDVLNGEPRTWSEPYAAFHGVVLRVAFGETEFGNVEHIDLCHPDRGRSDSIADLQRVGTASRRAGESDRHRQSAWLAGLRRGPLPAGAAGERYTMTRTPRAAPTRLPYDARRFRVEAYDVALTRLPTTARIEHDAEVARRLAAAPVVLALFLVFLGWQNGLLGAWPTAIIDTGSPVSMGVSFFAISTAILTANLCVVLWRRSSSYVKSHLDLVFRSDKVEATWFDGETTTTWSAPYREFHGVLLSSALDEHESELSDHHIDLVHPDPKLSVPLYAGRAEGDVAQLQAKARKYAAILGQQAYVQGATTTVPL